MHVGVLIMLDDVTKLEGSIKAEQIIRDERWCYSYTDEGEEQSEDACWDYSYGILDDWWDGEFADTKLHSGESVQLLAQKIKDGVYNRPPSEKISYPWEQSWGQMFDYIYNEEEDYMYNSLSQEQTLKYIEQHPNALLFVGSVHI